MSKRKYTKRRVSKRRVSKRRVSKRRVSKRKEKRISKKKLKGGSFTIPLAAAAGAGLLYRDTPDFLRRAPPSFVVSALSYIESCKVCNRIWKPGFSKKDWIWRPELKIEDTTLAGINYDVFSSDYRSGNGVCGYCNGNNMYNELIKDKHKVTAKIEVIKNLLNGDWGHARGGGKRRTVIQYDYNNKVFKQLMELEKLENAYRRLYLAKLGDIPIELYERISHHLCLDRANLSAKDWQLRSFPPKAVNEFFMEVIRDPACGRD